MKKIFLALSIAVLFIVSACSVRSSYEHEMYKNAVKHRSENSARQGMGELERETR